MTFPELDKKFDKTVKELNNNYNGAMMAIVGSEALSMLRDRIQKTGVNAKGQKFAPYSIKPMLIGCKTFVRTSVCEAIFSSKEKRKKLEWRTINGHRLAILPGGYKKVRELQGRPTDKVDFMVTGRMWHDIAVISNQGQHQKGIAVIGAKQQSEKDKLAGNTKRRGDILDLSIKEQDELKRRYNLQVLNVFKENGLQ
jgi:hypothetical protein